MRRRALVRAGVWAGAGLVATRTGFGTLAAVGGLDLRGMRSPVLFEGDAVTAYRDPAAVYYKGWVYLYFTLVRTEGGTAYSYVAWSKSRDLRIWTPVRTITVRDKAMEFGSPGDVVRVEGEWVMCLQTYPRPHGERYGNGDARLWTMRSADLEIWAAPELLRVKGPGVARAAMGRMIDPYLFRDKDFAGRWWCFYKQHGVSRSWSEDLATWMYAGRTEAGENPCVIVDAGEYVLFHSPANGVGMKRSRDLEAWRDEGVTTLGQADWAWAKGRLTGGFVLDLRREAGVRQALLFFHGSRYGEEDPRGGFDNFASIGVAWGRDLRSWRWAGPR